MIFKPLTANSALKPIMKLTFDASEEAGMFRQKPRVMTAYDKALAAQKASKEAAENKP